jgi:hypothetical protein
LTGQIPVISPGFNADGFLLRFGPLEKTYIGFSFSRPCLLGIGSTKKIRIHYQASRFIILEGHDVFGFIAATQ